MGDPLVATGTMAIADLVWLSAHGELCAVELLYSITAWASWYTFPIITTATWGVGWCYTESDVNCSCERWPSPFSFSSYVVLIVSILILQQLSCHIVNQSGKSDRFTSDQFIDRIHLSAVQLVVSAQETERGCRLWEKAIPSITRLSATWNLWFHNGLMV